MPATEPKRYDIYLDYKGYMIEDRSYRVFPAPLLGTRFATGRRAYSNLDFWQVGAMTDFTKGINQKFLVDPSQYYLSEGIDVSKEGEFKLERDLETQSFPSDKGYVTARYRTADALYLGTSQGQIIKTTDGSSFSTEKDTGGGKIYTFYEMEGPSGNRALYATRGGDTTWREEAGTWENMDGSDSDHPEIEGLYFVMTESDYAFGLFSDGIRQSTNGYDWTPEPPDPLWELPKSEKGRPLNAIPIQRGFLIGSRRGLWIFIGGGAAVQVWFFPDYASTKNFRGMDKFGPYGVFPVEGQGLFYTNGSGIWPTNLNWREKGIKITSCNDILSSGWDMFALVKDRDNKKWYLARCNMVNAKVPKYWWLVKELDKEPWSLSAFDDEHVYIHYIDESCEKYNKISGSYQSSGYLTTPLIDENLILLQKLYKSTSLLFSSFPSDTSAKIAYRLKDSGDFTSKSFTGDGSDFDRYFNLSNPTLGNRIQLKSTLETSDTSLSPVVTDLCWKYILERPVDENSRKRSFNFTVIAEDKLEKRDFSEVEVGERIPRDRQDLVEDIWDTRDKQEILNFVGADNEYHKAFRLDYNGSGDSCTVQIDRTNHQLITKVDGAVDLEEDYDETKIQDLASTLDGKSNYSCQMIKGVPQNKMGNDLVPIDEVQIKGGADIYWGTDIHAVIFNSQAPGQFKGTVKGRGSDRIRISLREI